MKKFAFALTAFAGLAAAGSAMAVDGTVEIRGRVVNQTCEVQTNYKNLVVVLDTVGKNKLDAAGKTAGKKPFHIRLQGCAASQPDATHVYASFNTPSAEHVHTDVSSEDAKKYNGTLKNRATQGGAENVAIQLLNNNGSPINLNPIEVIKDAATASTNGYTDTSNEVKFGVLLNYTEANTPREAATDANTPVLGKKVAGGETWIRSQGGTGNQTGVPVTAGDVQLDYNAQYIATGVAGAGIVEAFVNYTIAYK